MDLAGDPKETRGKARAFSQRDIECIHDEEVFNKSFSSDAMKVSNNSFSSDATHLQTS